MTKEIEARLMNIFLDGTANYKESLVQYLPNETPFTYTNAEMYRILKEYDDLKVQLEKLNQEKGFYFVPEEIATNNLNIEIVGGTAQDWLKNLNLVYEKLKKADQLYLATKNELPNAPASEGNKNVHKAMDCLYCILSYTNANKLKYFHPHISTHTEDPNGISVQWRIGVKELHLEFSNHEFKYVKIWGPNIETEMEVGDAFWENPGELYSWLLEEN